MLKEIYDNYLRDASLLGDFQSLSKTELANGYCDADDSGDGAKKSQYFSALMLRYWYKIFEFSESSKFAQLELGDFSSWVSESLLMGLKYRRWRDLSHPLHKDPNAPDKVFQRSLYSTRQRWLRHLNISSRKINYVENFHLEDVLSYDGDEVYVENSERESKMDKFLYDNNSYSELDLESSTHLIVRDFIKKGNLMGAVITDSISHQVYVKAGSKISKYELSKYLRSLNSTYKNYFESTYDVRQEQLDNILVKLSNISRHQLRNYVNKTLEKIKNNKNLMSMLGDSYVL
jgi:hypothetical protein